MQPMTDTSHFEQLIRAAADQSEPHQLLFVFAAAELPDDASAAQKERFLAGQGGALSPLMCVDKAPRAIAGFAALAEEADRAGPPWTIVFAAGLGGQGGSAPGKAEIDQALQMMVEAVRDGAFARFAAYDRTGDPVSFD